MTTDNMTWDIRSVPYLGPMVGQRVGPPKIYPVQSILFFQYTLFSGFMEIVPIGEVISSPAHLSYHSWPYGGPEGRPTKIYPIQSILLVSICPLFLVFPAHLSDHSWPCGGPEGSPTENIPHPIAFTCFNIRYPRFSWR